MTDFKGNEIKVGDSVVYIRKSYCTADLASGTVQAIKKAFGKELAYITCSYGKGVTSQSIYKVS